VDELTSRNCRVFYYDYPPLSMRDVVFRRRYQKRSLPLQTRPNFDLNANPVVVPAPLSMPFAGRLELTRRLEQVRLRRWFGSKTRIPFRAEPLRPHVAVVGFSWWLQFIDLEEYDLVCCDLVDDVEVGAGKAQYERLAALERSLLERSDIVFYTADRLGEYARRHATGRVVHLPNAANAELFRRRAEESPEPADITAIPHPRVGFVGAIFRWLDLELVARAVESLPDVSFVFVGPLEHETIIEHLRQLPNFHHLGVKPYEAVPSYVNAFDVCLCPFKTDRVGQAVDPVKIYEYFALGKPVVATRIHELAKLQPMTCIADNADEFARATKQAVAEQSPELVARRVRFALDNSWASRIDDFLSVIAQELGEKPL
jgi:glycosyltransferase involved in cell wall biosynthesis